MLYAVDSQKTAAQGCILQGKVQNLINQNSDDPISFMVGGRSVPRAFRRAERPKIITHCSV